MIINNLKHFIVNIKKYNHFSFHKFIKRIYFCGGLKKRTRIKGVPKGPKGKRTKNEKELKGVKKRFLKIILISLFI